MAATTASDEPDPIPRLSQGCEIPSQSATLKRGGMEGVRRGSVGCAPQVAIFDHLSALVFRTNERNSPQIPCSPALEPVFGDGKDVFPRVPFITGEVRDAVERVLTKFRGAKRVKMSGGSLPNPLPTPSSWGEGTPFSRDGGSDKMRPAKSGAS